jgi:hypothetical protein
MHPLMVVAPIREVARRLSPHRPIMYLAELIRCPRPTVKSWYTGHRRPPIWILEVLKDLGESRGFHSQVQQLEYVISRRKQEPKHRTGFNQIDPLTGCDKRNRLGRPKRLQTL